MINDRDRQILAETERQIRLGEPELARRFEAAMSGTQRLLRARFARVATSIPVMIILLLLLVGSMVLGLGIVTFTFLALATASIWLRMRRERDD